MFSDTLETTPKYRNLMANGRVSLAIGWEGEKTVQYEGIAFLPVGGERARYQEIYFAPWPDGRARMYWPGLVHVVVRPR